MMKEVIGTPARIALLIRLSNEPDLVPSDEYERNSLQLFQKHGLYDSGVTRKGHEVIREMCKTVIE